jgi:DNA-binding IclR family transcriptional regulator
MEEKTSFRLIFGDSAVVRVIDFFLDNREFDYSLTDIAKNAGIGWSTLHGFWKEMVKLGIVTETRRIGRAKLFKLNTKSSLVQKLVELDAVISKRMVEQVLEKQKIKVAAR